MKIMKRSRLRLRPGEGVIAPVFQKWGYAHIGNELPAAKEWLARRKLTGKAGEDMAMALGPEGPWLAAVGAGSATDPADGRKLAKRIIHLCRENRLGAAAILFPPRLELEREYLQSLADYLYLNDYAFDRYQKKKKFHPRRIVFIGRAARLLTPRDLARREIIARSVDFLRELVNEPPSRVNPDFLVDAFRQVARDFSCKLEVLRAKKLEEKKMSGLLAVGRGGCCEPALAVIRYEPPSFSRTVALVGKGITFDSGGLNLKPEGSMEEMKNDMAGAALVAAIVRCAAALRLPLRLIGLAPIAENMPGSRAYKPGDIISYANGKSVEIVNTDAEGRLILADALIEAARYRPDMIIEFSTLTGAMVVALGDAFAGMMTKSRRLAAQLLASGQRTGEFLWELPLHGDYRESIRSKVADLKNARYQGASAIKAGLFLGEFVGRVPFVHVDIAGTAFIGNPSPAIGSEGATGYGLRLMVDFFESLAS